MTKPKRKKTATVLASHEARMAVAQQQRNKHGLNEAFSEQTAIRNQMVELRAALQALPEAPASAEVSAIKEQLQQNLADKAEQLYHLINGPTH